MINMYNRYYVKNILLLSPLQTINLSFMEIRIFPNHGDFYNCIVIDTDDLPQYSEYCSSDYLPSLFVSDIIFDLID